jgi:hypothetical protein
LVSTSPAQLSNGTIELTDPVASTDSYRLIYTMNEAGWVARRKLHNTGRCAYREPGHLLNEQVKTKTGRYYRVRAERNEQLGLLVRGVIRFRA